MSPLILIIALPIFFLAYQAMGLLLNRRTLPSLGFRGRSQLSQRLFQRSIHLGSKLGFNRTFLENKKFKERLNLLLLRTGHINGWNAEDFLFVKEVAVIMMGIFLYLMNTHDPWAWLVALIAGFFLPDLFLTMKAKERQSMIQRSLPGFVDLLALTLESGMDFLVAVEKILEKMRPNALQDELQIMLQENRLGTPRKQTLLNIAFRTNLSDVQSFSSMIIQSEELGTSLGAVLRTYAEDMRSKRIVRAEEVAGKAPVKLMLPMVVFFFPIVFIIILGPIALNMMSNGAK